jgi:microcystin synthetase protein McyA
MRFERQQDGWRQETMGMPDEPPFEVVDLQDLPAEQHEPHMVEIASAAYELIQLDRGPLIRLVLFRAGQDLPDHLLVVVHHLVHDIESIRILLEDLMSAYGHAARASEIELLPKTSSFRQWMQTLVEMASSEELQKAEAGLWASGLRHRARRLPRLETAPEDPAVTGPYETVSRSVDPEQTDALLHGVQKVYRVSMDEILVASISRALARWAGSSLVQLDTHGRGREVALGGIDVSRTIAWLTLVFPLLIDLRDTDEPDRLLKTVKDQMRSIPNEGIGHGLLRYLGPSRELREELDALGSADVFYMYFGRLQQEAQGGLSLLDTDASPERGLRGAIGYPLEVRAFLDDAGLHLDWCHDTSRFARAAVERAAETAVEVLAAIAKCSRAPVSGTLTPSDFTEASFDQQELDEILDELSLDG